jgi:hypothetical protein
MLDQWRSLQIPEDFGASGDALRIEAAARNPVGHVNYPFKQIGSGGGPCRQPPP